VIEKLDRVSSKLAILIMNY